MRISKAKTTRKVAEAKTSAPAKSAKKKRVEAPELEKTLVDEVAGSQATAAKIRLIVERLLGASESADVDALVVKIAKSGPVQTAPGYDDPDDA